MTSVSNPQSTTPLLIVMGVSGSGKTTIAELLADHYGFQFFDADHFHSDAARAHMNSGKPLTDDMRAPWVEALKLHLRAQGDAGSACVLAFSGLKRRHRDALREAGLQTLFVFLHGEKTVIYQRLVNRTNHFMDPNLLDSQFDSLEFPRDETDMLHIDIDAPREQLLSDITRQIDAIWQAAK
ncbi:gluconokinase [Cellvibrio polysaccharolyticus]|uniref:Gluconokinase n=1 Tax=Cellvibrio polysaccharolyticus TaxID=2082724 RepID=A0A928V468_9GAMM|nr:gluconokinase, GntK/IdnK-type [Cellvibrio polysaccharolyticus]MBE8716885.1 adenylyl-sulfate kinase [Cellvibrio polysaccharolyticus]